MSLEKSVVDDKPLTLTIQFYVNLISYNKKGRGVQGLLIEAGFVYYTFEQEFIVVRNENNCRQCIID